MPKKTRKEKILADKRRKLGGEKLFVSNDSFRLAIPEEKKIPQNRDIFYNLPKEKTVMTKLVGEATGNNYSFIYKDLLRISIFTLLAIAIQFVLVWVLRTK